MDIAQVHEALASNRALIANTWEFFVTVHLALFGLIFLIDPQRVSILARIVMLLGYAGFMWLNYRAQIDNYVYARELIMLGRRLNDSVSAGGSQVLALSFNAGWVLAYLQYIYGGAALCGAALILTPHNPRRGRKSKSVVEE